MTSLIADLLRDHGPVLLARELPRHRSSLERAARTGILDTVLPGTYLLAAGQTWRHRALAVCRWHPEAVICGGAAAAWTFWRDLDVKVVNAALRTPVRRDGFAFTRRVIPPEFIVGASHGITMTAPELTAVDLIDELGGEAIDRALRSRKVTLNRLWIALAASPGRAGNPERRRLLLDSRDSPWSEAEREAHRVLRAGGFRGWRTNLPVTVGGLRYYLDIAFRRLRLAIEIDGRRYHDDPAAFEYDRARQNDLVAAGWTVLRFTWHMLVTDPQRVIATIRSTLRRCAQRVA